MKLEQQGNSWFVEDLCGRLNQLPMHNMPSDLRCASVPPGLQRPLHSCTGLIYVLCHIYHSHVDVSDILKCNKWPKMLKSNPQWPQSADIWEGSAHYKWCLSSPLKSSRSTRASSSPWTLPLQVRLLFWWFHRSLTAPWSSCNWKQLDTVGGVKTDLSPQASHFYWLLWEIRHLAHM